MKLKYKTRKRILYKSKHTKRRTGSRKSRRLKNRKKTHKRNKRKKYGSAPTETGRVLKAKSLEKANHMSQIMPGYPPKSLLRAFSQISVEDFDKMTQATRIKVYDEWRKVEAEHRKGLRSNLSAEEREALNEARRNHKRLAKEMYSSSNTDDLLSTPFKKKANRIIPSNIDESSAMKLFHEEGEHYNKEEQDYDKIASTDFNHVDYGKPKFNSSNDFQDEDDFLKLLDEHENNEKK